MKGQDKEILVHSWESTTHRTMMGHIVMAFTRSRGFCLRSRSSAVLEVKQKLQLLYRGGGVTDLWWNCKLRSSGIPPIPQRLIHFMQWMGVLQLGWAFVNGPRCNNGLIPMLVCQNGCWLFTIKWPKCGIVSFVQTHQKQFSFLSWRLGCP